MNFHEIMPDDVRDVYHKLSAGRCENGFGPRYRMNVSQYTQKPSEEQIYFYAEAQQYKWRVSGKYTDKWNVFYTLL